MSQKDYRKHYQQMESGIKRLLVHLGDVLGEEEKGEVTQFVDAGEYGVALETLCDILVEKECTVSQSVLREIEDLGLAMEMVSDCWRLIRTDGED